MAHLQFYRPFEVCKSLPGLATATLALCSMSLTSVAQVAAPSAPAPAAAAPTATVNFAAPNRSVLRCRTLTIRLAPMRPAAFPTQPHQLPRLDNASGTASFIFLLKMPLRSDWKIISTLPSHAITCPSRRRICCEHAPGAPLWASTQASCKILQAEQRV